MKNSRNLLSAFALASAGLLSQAAFAGTVQSVTQDIVLVDNQASVEHLIQGGNAGATFSDRYNFSTSATGDLNAVLLPRANNDNSALSITGFSLFDAQGKFVANATGALADGGWLKQRRHGTNRLYRMAVEELPGSAMRRLWHLVRDQSESWPTVRQDVAALFGPALPALGL